MSFAKELAAASMTRQEVFFKEIIDAFMTQCETEAKNGYCRCVMKYDKPSYLSEESQESFEILAQRLRELGLVNACASVKRVEVKVKFAGRLSSEYEEKVFLEAGWKLKHAEPEKTGKGTSSTCPVCFQNGPIVALMPCGHVVCKQCQRSQKFRKCPMCRQSVTGATDALFL